MIGRLKGQVEFIAGALATIDVHGVGYEVYCSRQLLHHIAGSAGDGVDRVILIHTAVREDAIQLYGFVDQLEREVFNLLIRVSGIGAKSAIDILSGLEPRELLRTIAQGDSTKLCSIKGVGKKTAERIILELKDRVGEMAGSQTTTGIPIQPGIAIGDAVEALVALGFGKNEAEAAVKRALDELRLDSANVHSGEIVREALRFV